MGYLSRVGRAVGTRPVGVWTTQLAEGILPSSRAETRVPEASRSADHLNGQDLDRRDVNCEEDRT